MTAFAGGPSQEGLCRKAVAGQRRTRRPCRVEIRFQSDSGLPEAFLTKSFVPEALLPLAVVIFVH
jgi:hypothetical protein